MGTMYGSDAAVVSPKAMSVFLYGLLWGGVCSMSAVS